MKPILLFTVALFLSYCSLTLAAPFEKKNALSLLLEKCHESAKLTQYWIPKEGEYDLGSNGQPIKLTGAKVKALKTNEGKLIAKVAPNTYTAFQMEGSGLLQDGRLINLAEHKNAFMVLDRSKTPFGIGPHGQSLVPWISVAANDIDIGTHLYIKQLDGVTLPNGLKHNGCVRVDDEGWSFNGCHIDFFVLQYKAFEELVDILPETVSVVEKQCTLKDYVNDKVLAWAEL